MLKTSMPLPQNALRVFENAPLRTDVISVLLVDDHALVREGLRQLFTLQEDMQVVGEAGMASRHCTLFGACVPMWY